MLNMDNPSTISNPLKAFPVIIFNKYLIYTPPLSQIFIQYVIYFDILINVKIFFYIFKTRIGQFLS